MSLFVVFLFKATNSNLPGKASWLLGLFPGLSKTDTLVSDLSWRPKASLFDNLGLRLPFSRKSHSLALTMSISWVFIFKFIKLLSLCRLVWLKQMESWRFSSIRIWALAKVKVSNCLLYSSCTQFTVFSLHCVRCRFIDCLSHKRNTVSSDEGLFACS